MTTIATSVEIFQNISTDKPLKGGKEEEMKKITSYNLT
jgi:hypothetical protein